LIGLTLFLGNVGGALGPWVAGKVFDLSGHYQWAFTIGASAAFLAILLAVLLKLKNKPASPVSR
jgi:MFS family permease